MGRKSRLKAERRGLKKFSEFLSKARKNPALLLGDLYNHLPWYQKIVTKALFLRKRIYPKFPRWY